jgi:hypothetical protein
MSRLWDEIYKYGSNNPDTHLTNPLQSASLQAFLDASKLLSKIPSISTADVASNAGQSAWSALGKVRPTLANLALNGIQKLKGEKPSGQVDKNMNFEKVMNELPSNYTKYDVIKGFGKLLGAKLTNKNVDTIIEKMQIPKGISPIPGAELALSAGSENIPNISASGITPSASMATIPKGMSFDVPALGMKPKLDILNNPILQVGMGLANSYASKIRDKQESGDVSPTGIPQISSVHPSEILKPTIGLGMDFTSDPWSLLPIPAGSAIKAIKKVAGPKVIEQSMEAFGSVIPDLLGSFSSDPEKLKMYLRTPSKILSPELKDSVMKAKRDINNFIEYAVKRVDKWAEQTPDIREAIGKAVISNDYGALENSVTGMKNADEIMSIAKNLRKTDFKAGIEAVKAGKLTKEKFIENSGTHVRRMYEFYENNKEFLKNEEISGSATTGLFETLVGPNIGKGTKTTPSFFKSRGADFQTPEEYAAWRATHGELGPEKIGYSIGEGSTRTFKSARYSRMYDDLANSPNYAMNELPPEVIAKQPYQKFTQVGMAKMPYSEIGGKQYIKMPESQSYGSLANKWIPRADGEYLVDYQTNKSGPISRWVEKMTGLWKTGKVAASSAAQSRNFFMSNPLQMMYMGVDPIDAFKYTYKRAMVHMDGKQDTIRRLVNRLGGESSTFTDSETLKAYSGFKGYKQPSELNMNLKKALNIPGKIYGESELIQKEAMFEYLKDKGLSSKEAWAKTTEALFDYSDKSKLVKNLSKSVFGVPFITYSAKAIPYTAKTILTKPGNILPLLAVRDTWNNKQIDKLGLTNNNIKSIEERYGNWYLITGRTKDAPEIIDLSYSIPGLPDVIGSKAGSGVLTGLAPQAMQPSHPLVGIAETIPSINKSFYFNKPIYKETDFNAGELKDAYKELKKAGLPSLRAFSEVLGGSKIGKGFGHIFQTLAPATAFMPGTYQAKKLSSAIKGEPVSYTGETMTPETALLSEFGIKTSPMNLSQSDKMDVFKMKSKIKEITGNLIKLNQDKRMDSNPKLKALRTNLEYYKILKAINEYKEKKRENK